MSTDYFTTPARNSNNNDGDHYFQKVQTHHHSTTDEEDEEAVSHDESSGAEEKKVDGSLKSGSGDNNHHHKSSLDAAIPRKEHTSTSTSSSTLSLLRPGLAAASVTPHDASTYHPHHSLNLQDDDDDVNHSNSSKQVRFEGGGGGPSPQEDASPVTTSATATATTSARSGGLVFSNRGRYVSPGRRVAPSSKSPSPTTPAGSGVGSGGGATFSTTSLLSPWHMQQPYLVEPAVTNSPSTLEEMEAPSSSSHASQEGLPPRSKDPNNNHHHPDDSEAETEAATALAGVAAAVRLSAAAAAASAPSSSSENHPESLLFEPKSPIPSSLSSHDASSLFLSTPKQQQQQYQQHNQNQQQHNQQQAFHQRDYLMTPTDFSVDYGKPLFDTSNVLAWLQSPTGLFSPGFGSNLLQTPNTNNNNGHQQSYNSSNTKGTPGPPWSNSQPYQNQYSVGGTSTNANANNRLNMAAAGTPRTPLVSTSFFFSDVAKLPKGNSTSGNNNGNNNSNHNANHKSIICISPLAMAPNSASRHGPSLLMSPPRGSDHTNLMSGAASLPLLSDTPVRRSRHRSRIGGHGDEDESDGDDDDYDFTSLGNHTRQRNRMVDGTGVDVLMAADRDCMEDEDLTVLLQLAANSKSSVFRHTAEAAGSGSAAAASANASSSSANGGGPNQHRSNNGSTKDLGLPIIGGSGTDLPRMNRRPTLEMRTSSSDISSSVQGNNGHRNDNSAHQVTSTESQSGTQPTSASRPSSKTKTKGTKDSLDSKPGASAESLSSAAATQSIPVSSFGYPNDMYYGPPSTLALQHGSLPPGIPPGTASGTMRVVVGGPPPPNASGSSSNVTAGVPYGDYGMPPPPMYGNLSSGMFYHHSPHHHPPHHHPSHSGYYYLYPPPPPPPGHLQASQPQAPAPPHPWGNGSVGGGGGGAAPPNNGSVKKKKKKIPKKPPIDGAKVTPGAAIDHASAVTPSGATSLSPSKPKKRKSPNGEGTSPKKKNRSPALVDKAERDKAAQKILAVNAACGGKNDKAASLAAAIMRGVTMRPSGKWQAQLYFAGKSRYIGVFDTREKAALAYEIAREKLKVGPKDHGNCPNSTENLVNLARKAAFDGVNEKLS